jgi:hypothetical protein
MGTTTPAAMAKRHQDQRGLVANATGGVLVDFRFGDMREVDHLARKHHFFGQIRRFLRGHIGKIDRHEQRRELVLRHFSIKRAVNDVANFFLTKLATVALLFDQRHE